jgi:intein/homing endonuclease
MTNIPSIHRDPLADEDFWWLIGYLQGDGSVDLRNGIWFHSTDHELIGTAKRIVANLFSLDSSIYVEKPVYPWKPRLRLAVYSRALVGWLINRQLRFGTQRWNVPRLSSNLFCSYLGGLFDAEGQVILGCSGKVYRFVIHSANGHSLRTIAQRISEFGVEYSLKARKRHGKPSVHYQLEIRRRRNLEWFARNVGKRSRLQRKNRFMTEEFLPRESIQKHLKQVDEFRE